MAVFGKQYDVIVVGGGHAGCEAALAAARMGCAVCMFAINLDTVAGMPCSPSVGGMGKGQLVKEVDALGGAMARVTDETAIQYRTLNTRKGPAVQSTRTQNDKHLYHARMKHVMERAEGIDVRQALVEQLVVEDGRVAGVVDATGFGYQSKTVVLATGTFLSGLIHIGHTRQYAGRAGEFAARALGEQLRDLGFSMGRMKTGTPARLDRAGIDFSRFQAQPGDDNPKPFSSTGTVSPLPRLPSHIGHTTPRTHEIIRENLAHSALYGGRITGVPARYCPSLEDKVVRFADRDRHQIILEPEGVECEEIYASGLGNSMPLEVQIELVRSIPGLEEVELMRPAYAIEYDYLNPVELTSALMTKRVQGLFTAGQINGTSGYEEAAAQGLWAGANAACLVQGRPPFVLDRAEAYMGVMVDDLVVRGTSEPYRMFTSRAEYRLLLREDNALLRLAEKGAEFGLVDTETAERVRETTGRIRRELERVRKVVVKPLPEVNRYLEQRGTTPMEEATPLSRLLKRAEVDYDMVERFAKSPEPVPHEVARQVEIETKYEGYIDKQLREIEKFRGMERTCIPEGFDYHRVHGLSNELKSRLTEVRPDSLGRASRVEGITPAALYALMGALRNRRAKGASGGTAGETGRQE
ncbi:MAG: tRNA uridine-5-carboxymethylaminomethyl(34) synthesis enzyme MnmG [Desulfatibacillaceae bacterium]